MSKSPFVPENQTPDHVTQFAHLHLLYIALQYCSLSDSDPDSDLECATLACVTVLLKGLLPVEQSFTYLQVQTTSESKSITC